MGEYQWIKWPNSVWNVIRFWFLMLISFVFLALLIGTSIRKNKENQTSILLRILANYIQLMSVTMSIEFKYPGAIIDVLTPIQVLGSATQMFISFDCFTHTTGIKLFAPSSEIFKMFLVIVTPLIIISLFSVVFGVLYWSMGRTFKSPKSYISITAVWVIFSHPTITKSIFSLFEWQIIEKDQYEMRTHLKYEWYSSEQIMWILILAVPSLIVWTIGIPLIAFIILLIKKNNLMKIGSFKRASIVLYQGFKKAAFYWEFVNTMRKVVLLFISTVLSVLSVYYTTSVSVLFLFIMTSIQIKIKPYEDDRYNRIKIMAIIAGTMTLFCRIIWPRRLSR